MLLFRVNILVNQFTLFTTKINACYLLYGSREANLNITIFIDSLIIVLGHV